MKKMSLFLLSAVLLIACENQPADDLGVIQDLSSYEIGKMHNEALAYYHSKNTDVIAPDEVMRFMEDYLISEKKYDRQLILQGTKQIMSTPEYNLMFNSKSSIDQKNILAYLDAVKKNMHPSDKLINTLKQAFVLGEEASPDEAKIFIINNIQKKSWTGIDKDLAYVFSDVFLHSYDYWTNTTEKKLKKSTLIILYDAGGAIHGMIFGPIFSIIESAALSAVVSEKYPD